MTDFASGDINASAPTDSDLIADGDDAIRLVKAQFAERLNSVFVDADSTPLVLKDNTVGVGQIAANSVGTSELVDGGVTTAKLANDSVTADKIAAGAVGTSELAAGAVTASLLAAGSITTDKLADNSVTNAKMADAAVGTAELIDNSVTEAKLADNSVATEHIKDGAVTVSKLAAGATGAVLEYRKVSVTLPLTTVGNLDTVTSAAALGFPGLNPGDPLHISLPTDYGNLADSDNDKLLQYVAVAFGDSFVIVIMNPHPTDPGDAPAGVYNVSCIKPSSEWA